MLRVVAQLVYHLVKSKKSYVYFIQLFWVFMKCVALIMLNIFSDLWNFKAVCG